MDQHNETIDQQDMLSRPGMIAVIGMAGRFPGAGNLGALWENLCNGIESVTSFTDEELEASGIDKSTYTQPNYVRARAVLDDIELFDAQFFGFTPREAEIMDPQHRIFMECAWEAIEKAGYDTQRYEGRIGIFAGSSMSTYLLNNFYADQTLRESVGGFQIEIGNDKDYLATHSAYKLNLKGPAITVQTACSTSLVTVHLACQSLLGHECDIALAGGVTIRVPQRVGYLYQEGGINSPDGHCRAFDELGNGIISGSGVGLVVLKRLEEAVVDGDYIHAVIRGSAVNNDGSLKAGYTAPSIDGQAEVIIEALAVAGVHPETISYVEAHGTGTALGDPIEIAALTHAFRAKTQKKGFCKIGSVKTNIGHLDSAAGIAGLIKTILCLKHKRIPPSLHLSKPNSRIDFENSPFYVNTVLSEWNNGGHPRRAGVSSFGIGGTNAHVIVEEAPMTATSKDPRGEQLFILSAKTGAALDRAASNLAAYLAQNREVDPGDVAYSLQVGREQFEYRRAFVCHRIDEALESLTSKDHPRLLLAEGEPKDRPIAFMFPGQGSQYVNMARGVYNVEPGFQADVDHCAEIVKFRLGLDLRDLIYPKPGNTEGVEAQLTRTLVSQPALFAIEYALARLWMRWGIHPTAMIGHSIGEYVAACLAGVFSLDDALTLVAARCQMMEEQPPGVMLAVSMAEHELKPLLNKHLSIAAVNSANLCVVSGPVEAVGSLQSRLEVELVETRRLHTSHAFHSAMMDGVVEPLIKVARRIPHHAPEIPLILNLTGQRNGEGVTIGPSYWGAHLRQTVRFADGLADLMKDPACVLLEVGPGNALSAIAKRQYRDSGRPAGPLVISSLPSANDPLADTTHLLRALGRLWLAGKEIDWQSYYANRRPKRIPLPTYPFERQRYWVEPSQGGEIHKKPAVAPSQRADIVDWCYLPVWKQSLPPVSSTSVAGEKTKTLWLLLTGSTALDSELAARIKRQGHEVVTVAEGIQFNETTAGKYTINPGTPADFESLVQSLIDSEQIPDVIVHTWSIGPHAGGESNVVSFKQAQVRGFYSLLYLTQALGRAEILNSIDLWVVSNNTSAVTSEEAISPEKMTVIGLSRVIPQEHPNIRCRNVDVKLPASPALLAGLAERLFIEFTVKTTDTNIAYRGGQRWVRSFERLQLSGTGKGATQFKRGGTYLLTGGAEGAGHAIAEYLLRTVAANLVLINGANFPPRSEWNRLLNADDTSDGVRKTIQRTQKLETGGGEMMVISADPCSREQMQTALACARAKFGRIDGVIHAARVYGDGAAVALQELGQTECELQFQTKAYPLLIQKELLKGSEPDFWLLHSSMSSELGGLGLGAYAAANVFMDAFAHEQNRAEPTPCFSLNWDAWLVEDRADRTRSIAGSADYELSAEEGLDVLRRVLSEGVGPQVVVSTADLEARINQWVKSEGLRSALNFQINRPSGSTHSRPSLPTPYVAPRNQPEQEITVIWQEVLGLEQVGVHDNFFELGGHSLMATQLISRLRKSFNLQLPMRTLFEAPTIAGLAEAIEKAKGEGAQSQESAPAPAAPEDRGMKSQARELFEKPEAGAKTDKEQTGRFPDDQRHRALKQEPAGKNIQFSLSFFASDTSDGAGDKYRLLREAAKYADTHGFTAIWTPERHFHAFGGIYPNPSVISAGLATITDNVQLRAGSVVLPLHNPVRVAEEWSVVDNLSHGRVAISFASGWHANDFLVFAPGTHTTRREVMYREIETVRKLWRGESIVLDRSGGEGDFEVRILPRPVQPELPFWITSIGSEETFRLAGQIGANLLTHMQAQGMDSLASKIAIYRDARQRHGHDPETGIVSLMLHTFIGADLAVVREKVRRPLVEYLKSSVDLLKELAESLGEGADLDSFTEDDLQVVLNHAFDRYFETSGLLGTPTSCLKMIEQLRVAGVDEVACLIDFGVDLDSVLESLHYVSDLKELCEAR